MLALKAHWCNWRNRQLLKLLSGVSSEHRTQYASRVNYSVITKETRKETTDLYLEMIIVLHTFTLGTNRSVRIDVHMGEVVAKRHYLDRGLRQRCQIKSFYTVDKHQSHYLLKRWVPWINSVKEINGQSDHDKRRKTHPT